MIKSGAPKNRTSALLAYPGFGFPTPDGHWRIFVSGVAWQEPIVFNRRQRMMIRMLGGVMKATPEELQGELFHNRISPFMAEADDRQPIVVEVGGQAHRLKKRTRKNGHFRDFLTLTNAAVEQHCNTDRAGNRTLEFHVSIDDPTCRSAPGLIYLMSPTGTCVVSDIDDTIKDSDVGNRKQLLANTFLRDFRSIDGMAEVYRTWSESGASFHYVSSSPWQLYTSLHQMNVSHRFPAGTMHLRNFRLRDQLLKKISLRRQGKTTAIRFLMKHLPERKFILIGDSGEKDPEIYRKICRKYPGRVSALFIREIPERPLEEERLRKIAQTMPTGVVAKFSNAQELKSLAEKTF